jgi:peptide subunit release factor 1 (eRF1)
MKFEIDLENSPLSEYFTEEEDGITFTEVFKEEVVKEFLRKMSWNSEFREFVRNELRDGLHPKIVEWK